LIPQQPWTGEIPPIGRALPFLEAIVVEDSLPDSLRTSALAHLPAPILRQRIPQLVHGITHSTPPLQHASVWALGLAGGMEAAHALEALVGAPSRPAALRADALVARAMASTHDLNFAHAFTNAHEPELRHAAQLVLGQNRDTEVPPRPTTTAAWIEATTTGGDTDRGRRLFLSPQLGCAKCHAFEGRGSLAGPNLGPLPVPPTRAHLVESILEPSRRITDGFQTYALTTRDEITLTGTHLERHPDGSASFRATSGQRITLPSADVVSIAPLDSSLMPEGLVEILTPDDLRDLLRYLTEVQP
jgi:putative heme-binding domain-containing protein